MEPYKMYLTGCLITCAVTLVANLLFKKSPKKADKIVDIVMFPLLLILIGYAISLTNWAPIEKKLSKELKEYRETQKNIWRIN